MSQEKDNPTDRDQRLEEILHAYMQAVDAGEAPERAAVLREHPEFADELEAFFADQDQIEQVARGMRGEHPDTPPESTLDAEALTLPPSAKAVSPGTKARYFGDYELSEEIARGGMAVVSKARQQRGLGSGHDPAAAGSRTGAGCHLGLLSSTTGVLNSACPKRAQTPSPALEFLMFLRARYGNW